MTAHAAHVSIHRMPIVGRRDTLAPGAMAYVDASLPRVYGAALAAAADPAIAEDVTCAVMAEAAAGSARADARALVGRAVLRAVEAAPDPAFAAMRSGDREAVALARLAGYTVDEVAGALGIAPAEARTRMTNGVRALAVAAVN
jgi:hypothetical protein